jgi:hypothetical protein
MDRAALSKKPVSAANGFSIVILHGVVMRRLLTRNMVRSAGRCSKARGRRNSPVSLPLFNREYADYTSSVHDPSSGFRWFPLSHESRLKITSCVDVASSASLLVLVFDPHMPDKED